MTIAPFRDPDSFYRYMRGLAPRGQDLTVEVRAPKGWGKSAMILWAQFRTNPDLRLKDALKTLIYSHRDFVEAYRHVRDLRKDGDLSPRFLWVDDASRLFDKRRHMTTRNTEMLQVYRTMRDSSRAVMFLGTQDDFLEAPVKSGGNYCLIEFTRKYRAMVKWPVRRPSGVEMEEVFAFGVPDPEKAYPLTWATYQQARARATDRLHDELLESIETGKNGDGSKKRTGPSKKARVLEYVKKHPKATSIEVGKAVGCTAGYVRQVKADADLS